MSLHIHFVGIKGTGMSALAQIACLLENSVITGSDVPQKFFTDELLEKAGITVKEFDPINVENADMIVASAAYDDHHPEIARAKELNIPIYSYPQFLGLLMSKKCGICISGTHGKTTTTAMIGKILVDSGIDPSIVVGSSVPSIGGNARAGKGNYFVAESCEYRRHFLNYSPQHLVVTNIEFDHPDYYKDIHDVIAAFQSLTGKLPANGNLIIWQEDPNRTQIQTKAPITTYGFSEDADIKAENIVYSNGGSIFSVVINKESIGTLMLPVAGKHNILDALAAIALAFRLGIAPSEIIRSLSGFDGTKRRFERLGTKNGAVIFDDYAHHPTEIQTTLDGVRLCFPDRRIRAVFQPHTFSRTEKLLYEFSEAFSLADEVVLADIFSSARENKTCDSTVSSSNLATLINQKGIDTKYFPTLDEISSYLGQTLQEGDLVITLGAGDIYKVGQVLIS
ncbi:UDP-N-acetylmuramate--L-alanine ligase [Syntrophobotulus glycolicus]|uniref:UDP-N-acetylmuramate--L-alanine ligase n=1 Tax=Syntrophobotulus glycolicus TaxID=51197 RepID=UPI00059E6735|nr:UDP-N-acetylmuramate--L-alanine ligase [Syntrophobotulus glycolicus]